MYTTVVGKTFLLEYNRRNKTDLSAKEFFDQVLFKIIFDHPRYLMWVQNSPFVQGIGKKKPFFSPNERAEKLQKLHTKIDEGERDASIALGFAASEKKEFATTSGLVSDLPISNDSEVVYLTWIGAALGIGVAGGYSLLLNQPEICYYIFEGWKTYRRFLEDPALNNRLRSNQLSTWNGQWLRFRLDKEEYKPNFKFSHLTNLKTVFSIEESTISINTLPWSKLFFALSETYPNSNLMAYVYGFGQTNKTIGFIPFQLGSANRLVEVYQTLFGEDSYRIDKQTFETLFGKHIKRACELGNIGLQALEPQNLRKYFADSSNLKLAKPTLTLKKGESAESYEERVQKAKAKDHQNVITFQAYKTWLIAMIAKNKTEISDYTREIAAALQRYRSGTRGTKGKNLLEKLFANRRKENFLENLIEIISDADVEQDIVEQMNQLRDRVHFMSREDFGYFVLLLKFDYAYQERIS